MATNESLREYLAIYVCTALENTPMLLQQNLGGYESSDPFWNFRSDPERFTPREMIAHVADWNEIYLERFQRTIAEDNPLLPNMDEGQIAIERDYAHSDPQATLERLARTRAEVVAYLRSIPAEGWDRMALREGVGPLTLSQNVALMMGHDGYHVKQAIEMVRDFESLPV